MLSIPPPPEAKQKKLWPLIKSLLEKEGAAFGFYLTSHRMDAARIASRALKKGYKK